MLLHAIFFSSLTICTDPQSLRNFVVLSIYFIYSSIVLVLFWINIALLWKERKTTRIYFIYFMNIRYYAMYRSILRHSQGYWFIHSSISVLFSFLLRLSLTTAIAYYGYRSLRLSLTTAIAHYGYRSLRLSLTAAKINRTKLSQIYKTKEFDIL